MPACVKAGTSGGPAYSDTDVAAGNLRDNAGDNGADRVTVVFPDAAIRNNQTNFFNALKLINLSGGAEEAQEAPLGELARLSEFDPAAVYRYPAEKDDAAKAVDQLLATYWPSAACTATRTFSRAIVNGRSCWPGSGRP